MEPGIGLSAGGGGRQAEGLAPDPFQSGLVQWGRAVVALAAAGLLLVEKRRVNIPEGFMQ